MHEQGNLFNTVETAAPVAVLPSSTSMTAFPEVFEKVVSISEDVQVAPSLQGYTLEYHFDLFKRLGDGTASLDEYKEGFLRLMASQGVLKAELSGKTKDQLVTMMTSMIAYRYKAEKKERCVDAVLLGLSERYALTRPISFWYGEKIENVIGKMVNATTEKDIADYVEAVAKAREEHSERIQKVKKALENPETADEFEIFIRRKGDGALTSEQRARYDERRAQANKEAKSTAQAAAAVAKPVADVQSDMAIIEGVHTKKNTPIWTVKLSDRVDRGAYLELKTRAQKLGGYYSSFRGNGAISGFIFPDKESAEKFVANDQISVADKVEARKDEKQQAAAQKLKEMADKLEEKGNEDLSRDRQVNTGRRARMAASAEAKASEAIALAKTMRNLAAAIESGEAIHLGGLRTKAQVEMLILFCERAKRARIGKENPSYSYYEKEKFRDLTVADIDYAEWPDFTADKGMLLRCAGTLSEMQGCKMFADELRKKAAAMDEDHRIDIDRSLAERIMEKLGDKRGHDIPGWWHYSRDELKRLDSMGITELPILRASLREFVQFKSSGPKADRAKELERALVGCDIPGFFPTPKSAVDRLIELAEIEAGMGVLEPEAGSGNIAEGIREEHPDVNLSVIEINGTLREILTEKGFNLVDRDFLEHRGEYDRILMNPPFEDGQDMQHIRHAHSLLRPSGKVVAICSEGPFFRSDRQSIEFRAWLDEVGGFTEDLEAGTFMDRTQVRTTGVKSRIAVVEKPLS